MTISSLNNVRDVFTKFFTNNGHEHVPASSLVPYHDPSLMFVNSGMVQFKNIFTGLEKRSYNKAVSCQKSLRAGGKHNDLENVGFTARHHTFFEMLGNFSFGDYFKEQAIYYAWNLLTKEYNIDKAKLYVTVYHTDDEAKEYWKKIANLSEDRIISIDTNDNFWSMGDTGPCGPCTEVFYDHGDKIYGGLPGTKESEGDRYVEIWNMVFMEYEQISPERRILLPKKSVDTGMGLERITAVLQGVHDNYDIDLFSNIISFCEAITSVKKDEKNSSYYKVIADHLRAIVFLLADGVMPSNEGRGYVLRRIIRRGVKYIYYLGRKEPLLALVAPFVISLMHECYPEIKRAEDLIISVLQQEEISFFETIDRGMKFLHQEIASSKNTNSKYLSGEAAFKLYDTFGFPVDLTLDISKENGINVDEEMFNLKMQEQRRKSQENWLGSGENKVEKLWFDIYNKFGATEFLGYQENKADAKLLALIVDGALQDNSSTVGQKVTLIANQTCFYGESGGQIGDIGYITSSTGRAKIIDCKKQLNKIIAHIAIIESGYLEVGQDIVGEINAENRESLRMYHTATHLLHEILRKVLGNHISQKGSLVANNRLRFDFNHYQPVTSEQIIIIENLVNDIIRQNIVLHNEILPYKQAIESGAIGLFGEKYEEDVRVVTIRDDNDKNIVLSKELCGGTHVKRTGDIGLFKITSEASVASGTRRIEALCGSDAIEYMRKKEQLVNEIAQRLKVSQKQEDLFNKINELVEHNRQLEKQLFSFLVENAAVTPELLITNKSFEFSAKLFFKIFTNYDARALRKAMELALKKHNNSIIVYVNRVADRLIVVVAVSPDLGVRVNAITFARKISEVFCDNTLANTNLVNVVGSDNFAQFVLQYPKHLNYLPEMLMDLLIANS